MSENSEVECSRFVIWNGASLDECSPEDRDWLTELLNSLGLESLQNLNGIDPANVGECADHLDHFLSTSDLGRLARVFLPGTVSQQSSNSRALLPSQSIDVLELSARAAHCLLNARITTIGELTQWSTEKLLRIKNMGRKSAEEIKSKLEESLFQNPDKSQSEILGRPESFCISALLSFEQCGIDEDAGQTLNNAGISRVDDLVTRTRESLRYWAGLSAVEVSALEHQLGHVNLHLESLLPLWVRPHYLELKEAFKEDVEQMLSSDTALDSAGPMPPNDRPTPTCLEEELDTFFAASVNDRNRQIVRRLMGWDGGAGTTLEQAGQEFDLTREGIRQILVKSLRNLTVIRPIFLQKAIERVERCVPASAESADVALVEAGITRTGLRAEGIAATAKRLGLPISWSIEEWNARRFVVNPAAMRQIQDFLIVARKRVSRYGITRKDYVFGEISDEVTVEKFDLYCSVLENIVWLDDLRDWFWLPTGKNAVLSRLAKILRVAPRLAVLEARAGVLRDRRMEDVELPLDAFRNLVCFASVVPSRRRRSRRGRQHSGGRPRTRRDRRDDARPHPPPARFCNAASGSLDNRERIRH